MSSSACALTETVDPLPTPPSGKVRVSEHRWSTELAAQLSEWAAVAPTLVVLPGGKALLSDIRVAPFFAEQVRGIWSAAHGERERDALRRRARSCTVLRFEPGADAALLHADAGSATGSGHVAARATLVVQLHPAPFFRFLYRRLSLGNPAEAALVERDATALLRHVLLSAWPCGQSRILSSSPRQARHRTLAFEAQRAMTGALASRHALEALARTLNVSPFHLAHVFRAEIGIPLHQYLVQLRLVEALERLAHGASDLSKLALDLGFSHHSHFSSHFRRAIGCSPREVRRMLAAEGAATLGGVALADVGRGSGGRRLAQHLAEDLRGASQRGFA